MRMTPMLWASIRRNRCINDHDTQTYLSRSAAESECATYPVSLWFPYLVRLTWDHPSASIRLEISKLIINHPADQARMTRPSLAYSPLAVHGDICKR